jgi:hypothetical protein
MALIVPHDLFSGRCANERVDGSAETAKSAIKPRLFTNAELNRFNRFNVNQSLDRFHAVRPDDSSLEHMLPDDVWFEILGHLNDPLQMRLVCSYFTRLVFNQIYNRFYQCHTNITLASCDDIIAFDSLLLEMPPDQPLAVRRIMIENEGGLPAAELHHIKAHAPYLQSQLPLYFSNERDVLFLLERYDDLSFLSFLKFFQAGLSDDVFSALFTRATNIKAIDFAESQQSVEQFIDLPAGFLPNLHKLLLHKTSLGQNHIQLIHEIAPNLEFLSYFGCDIADDAFDFIEANAFPKMKSLNLKPVALKAQHVKQNLAAMPNLESLFLNAFTGNPRVFAALESGHLAKLVRISLKDFQLTSEMLLDLCRVAPNLRYFGTGDSEAFLKAVDGLNPAQKVNIEVVTIAERDVEYTKIAQIIPALPNLNLLTIHKMCGLAKNDIQSLRWACEERNIELKSD